MVILFIVRRNGEISNVRMSEYSPQKDERLVNEAIRVIKLSNGKWAAGIQNGEYVTSYREQSINFVLPDQFATFSNIDSFISKNLKYPAEAKANKIEGEVTIKFEVTKEGKVINAALSEYSISKYPILVNEAIRIINTLSGKWKPYAVGKKSYNSLHEQKIIFTLKK